MKSEYKKEELGVGVRGKYYKDYKKSHNIVLLDPKVSKVFTTEEEVNNALLGLIKIAQATLTNVSAMDSPRK